MEHGVMKGIKKKTKGKEEEKGLREYEVSELKFKPRRRKDEA